MGVAVDQIRKMWALFIDRCSIINICVVVKWRMPSASFLVTLQKINTFHIRVITCDLMYVFYFRWLLTTLIWGGACVFLCGCILLCVWVCVRFVMTGVILFVCLCTCLCVCEFLSGPTSITLPFAFGYLF